MKTKILQLQGPILVLGASGFVGANLFRHLLKHRTDVYGTTTHENPWRLTGLQEQNIVVTDLLVDYNLKTLLEKTRPRTVFNCVAYGAYSFEKDNALIYKTNIILTTRLLEELLHKEVSVYVHAGSSSEYGDHVAGPLEDAQLTPNSHYAVSKAATSGLIHFYGKKLNFPCANLRLYSVYGPYEDSARLIPAVVARGAEGILPPFVEPKTSRDFVYVDDVCEAFIDCALNIEPSNYGESFNIGTGVKTTIADIANLAKVLFNIADEPQFTMDGREWDTSEWYANPSKARDLIRWSAKTPLEAGLLKTATWYKNLENREQYQSVSKRFGADRVYSISAIIACYKDSQAIPVMYERLVKVFEKLKIDYEIIFVNDNSPDNSEEVIRGLSALNRRVIGISHSRNFGSQSAFRSGMEIASKNACVLLDGDLQDPPELVEQFVEKWREGFDVVYGRRVKRDAPLYMQIAYKLFYRVFDKFSYIKIPHDAGDFSLMDKKVVRSLLRFPERDLFIRGIRAFAGFRQTGVDYVRPERMFGVSTNSLFKNIGWAKRGILSFSYMPLNILSTFGIVLFAISVVVALGEIVLKYVYPEIAPKGITTAIVVVIFFGAINLLGISVIGEYIAKILEEVKARPHFFRRNIIRDGEVRAASNEEDVHVGNGRP